MGDLIRVRRDSAADLAAANRTYAEGEVVYETDTRQLRVGDGVTEWELLFPVRALVDVVDEGDTGVYTLGAENLRNGVLTRFVDAAAMAVTIQTEAASGVVVPRGALFGFRAAGAGGITSWNTTSLTINGTLPVLAQHEEVWLRAVLPDEYDVVL